MEHIMKLLKRKYAEALPVVPIINTTAPVDGNGTGAVFETRFAPNANRRAAQRSG
jgi:hypothetical protein